jgi:hypothetical protein
MQINQRRYDIDTIRVIAIFLLMIYHSFFLFLSWGSDLGFIENQESMDWLTVIMGLMNTWRIPLLFFVSGMGLYFAFRKRTVKELLAERSKRILVPLLFGSLIIVPIQILMSQIYDHTKYSYQPNPSHLWFMLNIMIYVLLLLPIFIFLKRRRDFKPNVWIHKALDKSLLTIYLLAIPYVAEACLIPAGFPYAMFAFSDHGLLIGGIAFLTGFYILMLGEKIWHGFDRLKAVNLFIAFVIHGVVYLTQLDEHNGVQTHLLMAVESILIIFAVFGFGYRYLNRPMKLVQYVSKAVLPIYIIHIVVLFAVGIVILPLTIPAWIKLIVVIVLTIGLCFVIYEWVIKKFKWLYLWFGMVSEKE